MVMDTAMDTDGYGYGYGNDTHKHTKMSRVRKILSRFWKR